MADETSTAENQIEAPEEQPVEREQALEQQDDATDSGEDEEREPIDMPAAVEAICMVSDQPVPAVLMADVLGVQPDEIDSVCEQLARDYEEQGRGFVLAKVAGGWRYQSHPSQAEQVEKFVLDGQTSRLSGAALETLAIIAYKQPLSRAQIAAIRGVNVDGVLKTLQQRGYVSDLGGETGPSGATLFGTTSLFLERLGIDSLADLPPLGDFVPDAALVEILEQGLRPTAISLDADEAIALDEEPVEVFAGPAEELEPVQSQQGESQTDSNN